MDERLRQLEREAVLGSEVAEETLRRRRAAAMLMGPHLERYRVLLADPPWEFANYGQRRHGAARSHYVGLSVPELCTMPVRELAQQNAVCLLWCARPHSAEGAHARVLRAWGFRPVTRAFVWSKRYASGSPYVGLGHYTRASVEDCWLGVRGSRMRPVPRDVRELFEAPVTEHSRKPPETYGLVSKLWPDGERIELFCRGAPAEGWVGWGGECEGSADVFGASVGSLWPRFNREALRAAAEDEADQGVLFDVARDDG